MATVSELLFHLTFQSNTKDLTALTTQLKAARAEAAATSAPTVAMTKNLNSLEKQVRQTATAHMQLSKEVSQLGSKMSLMVTLPVAYFFDQATKSAASYEVQLRKTSIAFGAYAGQINAAANKAPSNLSMGPLTYEKTAGALGTLYGQAGVGQKQSASLTNQLIAREADLASYNGASPSDVAAAVQTAIAGGRTTALKQFLVAFSSADVVKAAQQMGLTTGNSLAGLSDSAREQAVSQVFLNQSAFASGSVAAQKGTVAGQLQSQAAQYEKLKVDIGKDLQPMENKLLSTSNTVLKTFNSMPAALQLTTVGMLGVAATAGPLLKVAASLIQIRDAALAADAAGKSGILGKLGGLIGGGGGAELTEDAVAAGGLGLLGSVAAAAAPFVAIGAVRLYQDNQHANQINKAAVGWAATQSAGLDTSPAALQGSVDRAKALQAQQLAAVNAAKQQANAYKSGRLGSSQLEMQTGYRSASDDAKAAQDRYNALNPIVTQLSTSLQQLKVQTAQTDDEMGLTPGLNTLLNKYDALGQMAEGTGKLMTAAMAPFDVTAAQAQMQTDKLGIQSNIAKYGPQWLQSAAGYTTPGQIAGDVNNLVHAQVLAGLIPDNQRAILTATQSMFEQQAGSIGINLRRPDVAAYRQNIIDDIGQIDVPVNLVPAGGLSWYDTLVKQAQQHAERKTIPTGW